VKPWAEGDIISICCAIIYLPIGLKLNPAYRDPVGWTVLLGTGISLGTLLLVLIDPLRQMFGLGGSLLAVALDEGRATLWWSAAVAIIYLVKDLFVRATVP
jgi:hypothetical protein